MGAFKAKFDPGYDWDNIPAGTTGEQLEDLGKWRITEGTITIDSSLSKKNRKTKSTARHELGHADQAARNPLEFLRQEEKGRKLKLPYKERPVERYADKYAKKAKKRG